MAARRKKRTLLLGLCVWQLAALAVSAIGYFRHRTGKDAELAPADLEIVNSFLHPSEADLRTSLDEIAAVRRVERTDTRSEPWQVALISALERHDFDRGRKEWSTRRDYIGPHPFDAVNASFRHLGQHPDDLNAEASLVLRLSDVLYDSPRLEDWTWNLWDRVQTPLERARVATVLSILHRDPGTAALQRAAMRLSSVATDFPPDAYAYAAMSVAEQLVESSQPMPALGLYRHVGQITRPGPTWGVAVLNQGILLHKSGYQAACRSIMLRLLASPVNDKDPGGTLTRTNQNYHHEAANLIADSYSSDFASPWAYRWRLMAAERYRFYSWCGTCLESAAERDSIHLFRDAFLAGPAFALLHMVRYPGRTWVVWFLVLAAAFIAFLRRLRHRRRIATHTPTRGL